MIIVDTNIVSEPYRPRPDPNVRAWIDAQGTSTLFTCTPVLAELRFGYERLDRSARKDRLGAYIERVENDLYRGRILSFDLAAAAHYAKIATRRERLGKRIEQMDALIAAIALAHGASVATRDVDDFSNIGLEVINPFDPSVAMR
jgi:predicted nucleic acid-binding protein